MMGLYTEDSKGLNCLVTGEREMIMITITHLNINIYSSAVTLNSFE